ncbi:N-terminal domain of NEFA-interacting nuclear protein NIP30-domain-containing protein [Panaeolus papilionaceus]|nr:N-terminal domain of NEFA-interacting nuclear protein NIP30-domain-containing protein [Panaeolus papilionaceus]
MDIPSLSDGQVGSRFITQDEVESAKARRDEQWKAAYARLGQEPPPQHQEEVYDGRSLAEKLAANKIAKQEEWEEKTKLANQFRALEEDEIMFLDSIREKQEAEERQRREMDGEELKNFKEAVAARTSALNKPSSNTSPVPPPESSSKPKHPPPKKDVKKSLKGVIVKKKAKPAVTPSSKSVEKPIPKASDEQPKSKANADSIDKSESDEELPTAKRRKTSSS